MQPPGLAGARDHAGRKWQPNEYDKAVNLLVGYALQSDSKSLPLASPVGPDSESG
jgi:hypothetical protein